MIIPLINPSRSRNRTVAGKVSRHLSSDIREMKDEIRKHRVLIRQLRKVNPRMSAKEFSLGGIEHRGKGKNISISRQHGAYLIKRHPSHPRGHGYEGVRTLHEARLMARIMNPERPALISRGFINPLTKERSMRFSLLRRRTHKRRAHRRHNPRFGFHRPTLLFGRGGWRRPKRSRLMRRSTRVNPRHRFHYRRNPALPFAIDKVALGGLKIAGGIAGGFLLKPIIAGFLPKNKTTGEPMFINLFGLIYVVGGAVAAGTIKIQAVKDVALVLAGVGVYDLIASNLKMLGLPTLPYRKAIAQAAGDEPGVIGASYQESVGADYAPALGSSYQEQAGADDISYGGDAIEID